MTRLLALALVLASSTTCLVACGGGSKGLNYDDPKGGKLRLIKDKASTADAVVLDFVVGDTALTGYSTGFDLPLDTTKVTVQLFTPGTALAPGASPAAASGLISSSGPLTGMLVAAQSQKASGMGAVTTDTTLPPGTVLFTISLAATQPPVKGVVFDGTDEKFVLPSGGLRDRLGNTVVAATDVAIGKLEINE